MTNEFTSNTNQLASEGICITLNDDFRKRNFSSAILSVL